MLKRFRGWDTPIVRLLVFYLVLALLCAPFAFQKVVSNDVWKSLYTGRYIAQTHSFPTHDEFAFTPVKQGVLDKNARSWLGNLTFYGLWRAAGISGLQVFRFLVLLGCLALIHGIVDHRPHGLVLMLLVLLIFGLEQKMTLRNALFLIPGLTVLFVAWHRGVNHHHPAWFWSLPIVLIAWSNLHASYLSGLGLLGLLLAGETVDRLRFNRRSLVPWLGRATGVGLVSLGGVLVLNPLGPEGRRLGVVWNLLSPGSESILAGSASTPNPAGTNGGLYGWIKSTMQGSVFGHVGGRDPVYSTDFLFPPEHLDQLYVASSVFLVVLTFVLLLGTGNRLRLSELMVVLASAWVGMSYLRTVALIPLTAGSILLIKADRGDYDRFELGRPSRTAVWITVAVLLVLVGHRVFFSRAPDFAPTTYRTYGLGTHPRLSSHVPDHLLKHHRRTNFYNGYSLGSWLIWRWWPDKKVFVDSKSSAFQPAFRRDVLTLGHYRLIKKYEVDHAVLPLGEPSVYFHFVPSPDWNVIGYDQGMIALRARSAGRSRSLPDDEACRMLLDEQEVAGLPAPSRRYLRRVALFIRRHGQRARSMGTFTHPLSVPAERRDILRDPCMYTPNRSNAE